MNSESDYQIPDEGLYEGVMVALTIKNFKKYQSEDVEPKLQMVFQFKDGDNIHYVRTQPFKNINNEKSTMVKLITGWFKCGQDKIAGMNLTKLLGQPAQLVIKHEQKGEKTYVILDSIMGAKKGVKTPVTPDEMPAFITKDSLSYRLAEGITIKEGTESVEEKSQNASKEATKPAPKQPKVANPAFKGEAAAAKEDEDDLPF